MNHPILSIILPVYNVESYIERCLNSVASQTFQDYELFLIDDGSTDSSGEICKKFTSTNSKKIQYIYKDNEGQGPARDIGVKLAKGKYITFLDADDWWSTDYCEEMIKTISKLNADIAVCDIYYIEENNHNQKQSISQIRLPEYKKIIPIEFPDSINRMRAFLWGKVFRRSLYIKSGLKQSKQKYEDFPVTSALVAFSRSVCRVNRPMYFYFRNRKDSTINYLSALGSIPDSIRNMVENFKRLKLFDAYSMYIEKMAFSQLRFAIKRMDDIAMSGQKQYIKSLKQSLFLVMKEYFPNWVNPNGLNVCVCGSDTLRKIVSTFLFKDADCKMDSRKRYNYTFLDLLDVDKAIIQNDLCKLKIDKQVIVRLLEAHREKILKKQYDELTKFLPKAITIFPDEVCNDNGCLDETAIWNIADLIWYKLFSGY